MAVGHPPGGWVVAAVVAIQLAAFWAAWRLIARRWARADAAAAALGGEAVALRGLAISGGGLFSGSSANSWSPRLSILPEGLRFKVVVFEQSWAWSRIGRVDLRRSLYGARVAFVSEGRTLVATVANRTAAAKLLRALPPDLPLTTRAKALRDGG